MNIKATREQIVEAADQLFYQQGFAFTSFAHIATAVNISRGNFYHHFKTKDDILDAVIDLRLHNTEAMLQRWEQDQPTPAARISCFIRILITNWIKIRDHGCPVGTLTVELAKLNHPLQADATKVFTLFRQWLGKQFTAMGYTKKEADEFAMHVMAFSQGAATVGNAFGDEKFVKQQVNQMCAWVDSLAVPQKQIKRKKIKQK